MTVVCLFSMPTLKDLRESEFMSQRDLAAASGVSQRQQ